MSIIRSSVVTSICIFLSRISGYMRDVAMAAFLGASALNDSFVAAFRLSNLFRSIYGEGAFNNSFVPIFSHFLAKRGKSHATRFASNIQSWLLICVTIFTIIIEIIMPYIINIMLPGFEDKNIELTISLARLTFPYLILISMAAFYCGILNTIDRFFVYALTPIILNLTLVFFLVFLELGASKAHTLA